MADVRKVVTVLFCDLAGYTSTGDQLDPEALRAIQSRYFDDARAALERHGGTVEKFIGDAVMAVFGIPTLHEDDALRALRAAIELRDAVTALGFQARIGVNTGEVVAGTGDALVTGDAVNVAARLEQAAEPSEILLGETTLRLARNAVEVEAVEPLALKGKAEPVSAHRLLRVVKGAPAFERRLDSPLVGRRNELARVRTAFDEALAARTCRLVTAFGPPGIGKTRLAREVATSLEDKASVLVGRCLPYGEGITYWPLAEIYQHANAEDAWANALGAGGPEDVSWTVRKWLEERAREHPLALVFEDIHWAEPPLLDLIEHVADWTRDAPLLLLCLARPDFLDTRAAWGGDAITLEPLTGEESDELIESLLGSAALEDATRVRIRDVAEGNPLFVEQLLAMLADGAPPDEVPATIQALLAARLDGLPEEEREIVERASIIGLDFEWEALGELAPDGRRPSGARLAALVRKDLIRPHEAIDDTFRFRHILIRDAAYERIPKSQRADLHERFAGWLDGRAEEFEEIVGYHLEQAHHCLAELGPETDRSRAIGMRAARHLGASGTRAADRDDTSAVVDLLGRAVRLWGDTDPERVRLLPKLGRALLDRGEFDQGRAVLEDAMRAAESSGDRRSWAEAAVDLDWYRVHTDPGARHADVRSTINAAVPIFEEATDASGLARALMLSAYVQHWHGDTAGAVEKADEAARYAREAGDVAQESDCLRLKLGLVLWGETDVETSLEIAEDVRRRTGGVGRAEIRRLTLVAELEAMAGRVDVARRHVAQAEALADERGERLGAAYVWWTAGTVELLAGDLAGAEAALMRSCNAFEQIGDWGHLCSVVPSLADTLYKQGRIEEAEPWIELCSSTIMDEDTDGQIGLRRARAKLAAARGDVSTAERLAREAVELAEGSDYLNAQAQALADLGEVLRVAGRIEEAGRALEEAIIRSQRKGNVARAIQTRAALAALTAQPPATA